MIITGILFSYVVTSAFTLCHQLHTVDLASSYRIAIFESLWTLYFTSYLTLIVYVASATTREVRFNCFNILSVCFLI